MKTINFHEWEKGLDLSLIPAAGERIRKVVHRQDEFEVIVNYWGKGCSSALHGHGGSDCYFKVITGKILESQYTPFTTDLLRSMTLVSGDHSSIRDVEAFHTLLAETDAISLHFYDRPLKSIQVFEETVRTWGLVDLRSI